MEIQRFRKGKPPEMRGDTLAVEEPLAIRLDGKVVNITMRTPGHDGELAAGFLLSEGIVRSREEFSVETAESNRADVTLAPGTSVDFAKLARHTFASSSCGLCGKTAIDRVRLPFPAVNSAARVKAETLLQLPPTLRAAQRDFEMTGGIHGAGLFNLNGELVLCREDIGRHNAVDKVLGHGLLEGLLPFDEHVLLVSGRASFEILQKALAGGFGIVAAVSAPSSLAVDFAKASRQTLVGFLRDGTFNVYTGGERIDFS